MNLPQVIAHSFHRYRGKKAIQFEGKNYTFGQMDEEVRKRAGWLKKAGVRKGDRVALLLPKGMEFIFFHLGALSIGGVSLPLNPGSSGEEAAYYLADSETSLFITDAAGRERVEKFLEPSWEGKTVLTDDSSPDGWDPLPRELEKTGPEDCRTYPAQDDEVAMIIYTSGTTGRSKGAMITHRNLVTNMAGLKEKWQWTDGDTLLHVLPLFHLHGLVVALHGAFHAGSTVIMHEKFDPCRTWEELERERCTLFMAVPTIYHRMLKEGQGRGLKMDSMRLFISGSAPLAEPLFHSFEEAFGFRILERYGMTEAGIIASNPLQTDDRIPLSVGYPLPGIRVRIAGQDGWEAPPGEVGEVWIQGKNVFQGYWKMPQKTEEAFRDGWFRTGDLGYREPKDSGRLFLAGRAKEVIITGGYNVYPKEVEGVLERHEAIQEAAVIGVPDDDFGERVVAAVAVKKGRPVPGTREIIRFCKEHLTGYKCPKEVSIVPQLPRNAMGKVLKNLLKENFDSRQGAKKEEGIKPSALRI